MKETLAKATNIEESLIVAMLLALVGGYLDIYSYLARGRVFANTQTGNLVLLGYHLSEGNWHKVLYYSVSIMAFLGGVGLAKVMEYRFRKRVYFNWVHLVLILEMILLLVVMWVPEGEWNVLANILVSFTCALQVQGFRKVQGNAYSTVMFTGNLKNVAEQFSHYQLTKEQEALQRGWIYLGIILMFMAGGWLGGLTVKVYGIRAVWLVDVILMIVFILLYVDKRREGL